MEPAWDDVVCARRDQVSSRLGAEVAILRPDPGLYYGLNATGARVWELLAQPIQVREIGRVLVDEFAVDEATARRDLLAVLSRLAEAGLVEVRPGDVG